MTPVRKLGKTVVRGEVCPIWECKETHEHGRRNNCNDDVWIKIRGEFYPWLWGRDLAPCWGIEIKQGNHTKVKYGETMLRGSTHVEIRCNCRPVYEIRAGALAGSLQYALAKAGSLIVEMQDHPFDFVFPENMNGRPVYYRHQPAVVDRFIGDQGAVVLRYDGDGDGFDMIDAWDEETDWPRSEWHGEETVKDDVLTDSIWWFRGVG